MKVWRKIIESMINLPTYEDFLNEETSHQGVNSLLSSGFRHFTKADRDAYAGAPKDAVIYEDDFATLIYSADEDDEATLSLWCQAPKGQYYAELYGGPAYDFAKSAKKKLATLKASTNKESMLKTMGFSVEYDLMHSLGESFHSEKIEAAIDQRVEALEKMKGKEGEQFTKRRAAINDQLDQLRAKLEKAEGDDSRVTELTKEVQRAGAEYYHLLSKLSAKEKDPNIKKAQQLASSAREAMMAYLNESLNELPNEPINESYGDVLNELVKSFDKAVDQMRGSSVMQIWNRPEAAIWIDLGERKQFCDEKGKLLIHPK